MSKSKKVPRVQTLKTNFGGVVVIDNESKKAKYKKVKFTKNGLIYK